MTEDNDREEWVEKRAELAREIVSSCPHDDRVYRLNYDPLRLLPDLRRAMRGLDTSTPVDAARKLTAACAIVLQLVEELRYPRWSEGFGEALYLYENAEELISNQNDDDRITRSSRTVFREIRARVRELESVARAAAGDFDVVARNGHRRSVNEDLVSDATTVGGDLAMLLALVAVELHREKP